MKYYLINDSYNWADEIDYPIFELLTEEEYVMYNTCKEILESYIGYYSIGTNEDDLEFDFFDFYPIEISEEDYHVLCTHMPLYIGKVFEVLLESILDDCRDLGINCPDYITNLEELKEILYKLVEARK